MNDEKVLIYGKNPVFEYIEKKPGRINKIYIREDASGVLFKDLKLRLSTTDVQLSAVPLTKLNKLAGKGTNHQGLIAEISPVPYLILEDWLDSVSDQEQLFLIIADSIQDPHNFGAIIRTAVAAGASALLMGMRDQVSITGTVIKTSSGLAEDLPIIRVPNLNQGIRTCQQAGFNLVGTKMDAPEQFTEWTPGNKEALIIGSEGFGMRKSVEKICDQVFSIPMNTKVESLNASVSAALLMYEWRRKQH